VVQTLGLPIPMPQDLKRAKGPSVDRPLDDRDVAFHGAASSALTDVMASILTGAGANPFVNVDVKADFAGPSEAFGRPARDLGGDTRYAAQVFDATTLKTPEDLRRLHDFFNPIVRQTTRCARILVLGRPPGATNSSTEASVQAGLTGFVRSLAKEVGKKGSTANLLQIEDGAQGHLAGPVRFLLSERSAYVSGQVLNVVGSRAEPARDGWASPLEGKVALVTGAARGIGAATARLLASEGARVVCLDRPADDGPASKVAREIDGRPLLIDVTDADAPERISAFVRDEMGGVDIVVHNAGVTRDKTLAKMDPSFWDMVVAVNLDAVVRITDALCAGPLRDGGRVICLSSIAGIAGNVGQTNYAASKAAIIGLVQGLASELAERNITANAIAPGFIETRLTDAIPFAIREVARRMNALGQGGRPDDVAQAINFFASPGAQGLTGQVLRVCGGALVGA
jgi:3-oxoacyl-[acyl-carrier protein] reductase